MGATTQNGEISGERTAQFVYGSRVGARLKRTSSGRVRRQHRATDTGSGVLITLRRAIEAHQGGELDTAETLYRRALQMQAGQPDALHFLGVLCHQRGRSGEAVRLIRMALRATPQHADAHNNLGNVHKEIGNLAEAEACYRSALACNAHHQDALGNLIVVLEAQQRPEEALRACSTLIAQAPQLGRAHYLMACTCAGMDVRSRIWSGPSPVSETRSGTTA